MCILERDLHTRGTDGEGEPTVRESEGIHMAFSKKRKVDSETGAFKREGTDSSSFFLFTGQNQDVSCSETMPNKFLKSSNVKRH